MKLGQKVALIGADGERQTATVTAVPGTGKSGFKTLDLDYKGGSASGVVHGNDRVAKEPYWLMPHEKDVPPEVPAAPAKSKAKARKRKT